MTKATNDTKKEKIKPIKKTNVKEKKLSTTTSKTKPLNSTKKKKTTSTTKSKVIKAKKRVEVAEYYDLPYRYNETVVKILYQTPNVLFVYWDISDEDKNNFIKKYGENFFYSTKPILKIYNLTKNYNFEIEIDDFANSWYINVEDSRCNYKVELSRKVINYSDKKIDYVYVSSSNSIEFPNDHILLEELPNTINFKNVKTNLITTKNIKDLNLSKINKSYNIYNFYKLLYKDEILEEINNNKIINPSSSSWK